MSSAVENSDLPNGWAAVPLGDVIKLEYGKALTKKTRDETGEVPVYGSSGDVGRHNEAYIDEPCLIVGRKGNVGNIFISHQPCWPIDTVYYVIPPEGIDIKYLYYQLGQLNLARLDKSTAIPGLNRNDAYKVLFKLAPPEQQKRIVAKIEELFSHIDAGIEALIKAKQFLKQYRQSVLKAAVTGELTKEWRDAQGRASVAGGRKPGATEAKHETAQELLERILKERRQKWEEQQLEQFKAKGKMPKDDKWKGKYKEPKPPALLVELKNPVEWELASIDQVAEVLLGKMLDKAKHTAGQRLPYLRNINVRWGSINTDDLLEMFFRDSELERYDLNPGDVLVCEGGEPGRAAVWEGDVTMKYQKALHRIRFYLPLIPQYLVYLLEYFASTGLLEQYFTGSTIKHFTKESFVTLPFPLPTYKEMQKIVEMIDEKVSSVIRLEGEIERQLLKAEKNKQSILASAFSGGLIQ